MRLRLIILLTIFSVPAWGDLCPLVGSAETVTWEYIPDGDTLWLKDGRKVRFPSINTPELARDGRKAEPFAEQAHKALETLLKSNKKHKLLIQKSSPSQDHYGRTLAYPFLTDGQSIEALLVQQGLAIQIMTADKNPYQACIQSLEQKARVEKKGVWSTREVLNIESDRLSAGFQLIKGKVVEVKQPRNSKSIWVILNGPTALKIPKRKVSQSWLHSLVGKNIEVRGWLVDRSKKPGFKDRHKRWVMGIYSEGAVEILN